MKNSLPRFATIVFRLWKPTSDLCDAHHISKCPNCTNPRQGSNATEPEMQTVSYVHKATKPIPQRNLDDELWGIEHLACHLGLRVSAANAYAHHPDFPLAIRGNRRFRKWPSVEVRSFLLTSRGNPIRVPRLPSTRTAPEIHEPQHRKA